MADLGKVVVEMFLRHLVADVGLLVMVPFLCKHQVIVWQVWVPTWRRGRA